MKSKMSAVIVVAVAAAGVGFHTMLREREEGAEEWRFSPTPAGLSRPGPAAPRYLVAALLMYTQDYDEKLPPLGNGQAAETYLPLGEVGSAVGYGVPANLVGVELPSTPTPVPFVYWKGDTGEWFAGSTDGQTRPVEGELPELAFYR